MSKIKTFLLRLRSFAPKILAIFSFVLVIGSILVIPSFAAEGNVVYATIAPISFTGFSGEVFAQAFPGSSSLTLFSQSNGSSTRGVSYLNNDIFSSFSRVLYKTWDGISDFPYFRLTVKCNYSNINLNGIPCQGSVDSDFAALTLRDVFQLDFQPFSASFDSSTDYYFNFDILLYQIDGYYLYDEGYQIGKSEGYNQGFIAGSSAGSESSFRAGYNDGYYEGFADGREASDSQNLGQNLLGDTLNAPFEALNGFIIYESASGFQVTLGLVIGGAICMTLFIAFLKIFAGG